MITWLQALGITLSCLGVFVIGFVKMIIDKCACGKKKAASENNQIKEQATDKQEGPQE